MATGNTSCFEIFHSLNMFAPKSILQPLIILQKKIMRIITFSKYDSLTAPIFNNLKILNLTNIYKYNLAISFHKIFNNKTHGSSNLVPIDQVHHHFTRLSKAKNY